MLSGRRYYEQSIYGNRTINGVRINLTSLNGIVTMFKKILGLVTSPQIAIDAIDIGTVFGELEDWNEDELSLWIDDIINFHIDMALGYS